MPIIKLGIVLQTLQGKQRISLGLFVLCLLFLYGFENQFDENYANRDSGWQPHPKRGDPKGRLKLSRAQQVLDSTVRAHAQKCVHSRVATAPAIHAMDHVRERRLSGGPRPSGRPFKPLKQMNVYS